ncbi:phage tail tube protein [Nitrospina gracilis]|uniref:phage tail tube protein n=1 Tax=Nitrospina gracilis TaxID=35801 RepID=UPI001F183B08|nr:phage tail tube protein [Nitrospina gracilis]MCF8719212.1 hypothetical protein [Nitrospina gracilis Nb-211]
MSFLEKRSLLLAKVEVTYGTDPVPAPATDAILVNNPQVRPTGEVLRREFQRSSLSPLPHVIGLKESELTFSTELKGSGTANAGGAGDIPEIDPLLQACGMNPTFTAESSGGAGDGDITYNPVSSSLKSVTLYWYNDGLLHKLLGAVGNMRINGEAGQFGTIEWTFRGLYVDPTDADIPGGAVFNAEQPPILNGISMSVHSYQGAIQAFAVELANEIARRNSVNAATGVVGFLVTGRDTQGSMNPEQVKEATHDFWAKWKAATQGALSMTIGTVAGAKIDITAPKVQYRELTGGARDGVRIYDVPLTLAQNSGDDELALKFY